MLLQLLVKFRYLGIYTKRTNMFQAKSIKISTVVSALLLLSVFQCKRELPQTQAYINPAFGEYISSYTAGAISSGSPLRIVFVNAAIDSSLLGEDAKKYFDFSPAIRGEASWLDLRTLEFKPEGRMPNGQVFEATVHLSKLFKVAKALEDFRYSFQVIPQNFEFTVQNVKPYVKTELKRLKVEGALQTADFADNKEVESMLQATQGGKRLKVAWLHSPDGRQRSFVVEDVVRSEQQGKVLISVKGNSLGIDRTAEQEVDIPALGDFRIMNARVVQNPSQYVILQFSDPLKGKQPLQGLISIGADHTQPLEFDVRDNEVWIYPAVRQVGTKVVTVEAGVRNILDYKMEDRSVVELAFEQLKPEVRFAGKGSILPSTDGLVLPFEAVNLKAVDVSVKRIFENNMLQFLQVNNITGTREMYRVGRNVLKKTVQLDNTGVTDLGKWNRFTLDLAKLIDAEPGAIYQVAMRFRKSYSLYQCEGQTESELTIDDNEMNAEYEGYREYDSYDGYYYYGGEYDWNQRDNPCNASYYSSDRNIQKNILASDIGLLAKVGDDQTTTVFATDLKTTKPMAGVSIELYDFQLQPLGKVNTDGEGKALLAAKVTPFAVVAKAGIQRGYIRLVDGESLSLSGFDVAGESVNKGLKGFLYGERGVWRPGDSLFLSFILEDKNKSLPPTHPVVFELHNPQGVVTSRLVKSSSENGFYKFSTATTADAPTGNWAAKVKVGGTEFNQQIKIETIKPNRLKLNLTFGQDRLTDPNVRGNLQVNWLHGAPGRNLKAEFEATLLANKTSFVKYDDFNFEEPGSSYSPATKKIFEGYTDGDGKATFNANLEKGAYPGFMTAVFRGKVFEESGNFSIDRFTLPFYPYQSFAGLRVPLGEKYSNMLYTNQEQTVDIVFLDIDGKPVVREGASVSLYRLERYWWWNNSYSSVANYIERNSAALVSSGTLRAPAGKASWTFSVAEADWGTYYLKVCDPVSGHCAGKTMYIDAPGYFGRYAREQKGAATRLSFTSDKTNYTVGEKITLAIPGSGEGRALVSIENGSKIISTQWVETKKGDNKVTIEATAEMTPNIFVNVTLLQPHAQTINDLPIRLYGVIPVGVENPGTHLEPVIEMANEIEPGQQVRISVSERLKRKMTFTLAMVDEGLLDITRFKTPEPWKKFYAREALGVKTWDLYDEVMGAFGARIERLLAVGGSDELKAKDDDPRANRFKPVVKYFGPFTVEGRAKELTFTMPQYIGSVKVMAVAGDEGAYGQAEKVVPVRKPLMVLATLPRVLGPDEKVTLPITLFTSDKKIRNVKVEVIPSGPLRLASSSVQNVVIPPSGDLTVDFNLHVQSAVGIAKVMVKASAGSYQSTDEIEIEVRNPNVPATQVTEMVLQAGKTWEGTIIPVGVAGTNSSILEVSSIPPINLGYRLRYLMDYPHGCLEQTTSAAFPQLYLNVVKELTENEKRRIKTNVTQAIERLKIFITRSGGFGYWPGNAEADDWGTNYAGHFLVEASNAGYFVSDDLWRNWKKYQKNRALQWRANENEYFQNDLVQAYRLYTLAMAGAAELPAMNRLRELDLSIQSKWMLAAAYAKVGQPEAARNLIDKLSTQVKKYQELGYTYGSDVRDKAIILETLVLLKDKTRGFDVLREIAAELSNHNKWMSTQTIAYSLKSVGQYIATDKPGVIKYAFVYGGKQNAISSLLPISQQVLDVKGQQKAPVNVTNQSEGVLFVRMINTGVPARGQEVAEQSDLVVSTSYTDMKGNSIDITHLEQGAEFMARVTVKNPGVRNNYRNLALSQVFPSGWEINNLRLNNDEALVKSDRGDYQDIRDDRVYTYFTLAAYAERQFSVVLTAGYAGTFYLPGTSCEAMYDRSIYAKQKGQVVEVTKRANTLN